MAGMSDCSWTVGDIAGVILLICLLAIMLGGGAWASWSTERDAERARKGGCICSRNSFWVNVRSDCPYCNKKGGDVHVS